MISISILREYMSDEQSERVSEFMAEHGVNDNAKATCKRLTVSNDRVVTVLKLEGIEEGLIL